MGQWDRVVASKVVGLVEIFEFVNVRSHPYRWVRPDLVPVSSMLSLPSCCKKKAPPNTFSTQADFDRLFAKRGCLCFVGVHLGLLVRISFCESLDRGPGKDVYFWTS